MVSTFLKGQIKHPLLWKLFVLYRFFRTGTLLLYRRVLLFWIFVKITLQYLLSVWERIWGPDFIKLLWTVFCSAKKNEQDQSQMVYMWHGILAGIHILVTISLLCLSSFLFFSSSTVKLGPNYGWIARPLKIIGFFKFGLIQVWVAPFCSVEPSG